jgi:hypothetical protein
MNEYDLLLHWFSTRPHGEARTALVTDACTALARRANEARGNAYQSYWRYHFLDPLHRLGHVERVGQDKWAVLPPTVLWVGGKRQEGEIHLYGARSRTLQEKLQQEWGQQFMVVPQNSGPALWKWVGPRSDAVELAHSVHSELYEERGNAILEALPSLAKAIQSLGARQLPTTKERWEFFQVTPLSGGGISCDWVPLSGSHALHPGVYRAREKYPTVWVYVSSTLKGRIQSRLLDSRNPDHRWVAQWLELARSHWLHLRYDVEARTLGIPDVRVPVPLPVLVDRALRLASGTCPNLVTHGSPRYLTFANIDRHRARQASRVLGLRLETVYG